MNERKLNNLICENEINYFLTNKNVFKSVGLDEKIEPTDLVRVIKHVFINLIDGMSEHGIKHLKI